MEEEGASRHRETTLWPSLLVLFKCVNIQRILRFVKMFMAASGNDNAVKNG